MDVRHLNKINDGSHDDRSHSESAVGYEYRHTRVTWMCQSIPVTRSGTQSGMMFWTLITFTDTFLHIHSRIL